MLLKLQKQSNVEGRAKEYDSDLAKKAVQDPDKQDSASIRHFVIAARHVALLQVSSACVEQVFFLKLL